METYLTSFVGRKADIDTIIARLTDPSCRLLSLVGMGGIGKTRLALECVARLAGSVTTYSVFLQAVHSTDGVLRALVETVGIFVDSRDDALEVLGNHLRDEPTLILFDNAEHLPDAAPLFSQLVSHIPSLTVLVTSRAPLKLQEEWLIWLEGLPHEQAVALFAERAQQIDAGFQPQVHQTALNEIANLTEGMPLALELAASWVHVLSPAHIADELRHNLDLLRTDVRNIPKRHRNIRATFDLSLSRLTEREREIFLRLAVFDGEFTRDAAEAVTGATLPLLLRLVNQSLLRTTDGAYSLHQLVKQYALTALPDEDPAFTAHSAHYLDWLTQQENDLKGHNQREAHQGIVQNVANIRAAHAYAVQQADVQRLMRVAEILTIFFENRSTPDDAIQMLQDTLPLVEGTEHGRILLLMGWLKTVNGEPDAGLDYLRRGRTLLAAAEDYHAAAMSLALFSWFEAADELDFDALRTMYTDHATADPTRWQRGWFLYGLGNTLKVLGQQEAALNILRECERVFHEVGDRWAVTWALGALATLLRQMEQWHAAAEVYRRSYAICEELHDIGGQIHALIGLNDIALAQHNYREALSLNHHILTHIAGNRIYSANVNFAITGIARAFAAQGDGIRAVEMLTTLRRHPMFESVLRQHERREIDNQLAKLREGLHEDDFQQATQRGAAITVTDLANMLLDELATTADPFSANSSPLVDHLTYREQEVLALLAEGRSNRDIADALVIALGTVKTHVHNISSKLNARSRGEAVARARQLGLLD